VTDGATERTREVRRRSRYIIIGAAILCVADFVRLWFDGGVAFAVGAALSIVMGAGIIWWLFSGEARRRAGWQPGDLYRGWGTVTLRELLRSPLLAPQMDGAKSGRGAVTGGMFMGTLVINHSGVQWTPAWWGRGANMHTIAVAWADIRSAHADPKPGLFDPAVLTLDLRDGSRVQIASRRPPALRAAIQLAARP
jgi:hypothetical protein